ncbi:MAG TPA: helix-turn-helix transcriptional regulator [Drouetiella sp.]
MVKLLTEGLQLTTDDSLTAPWLNFLPAFGERVKAARLANELTEEHTAHSLGISIKDLVAIEQGLLDAEITTVVALSKLFKIPVSELV